MNEVTVVADYGDLCGEGPLWDADAGVLYWTDCVGLKFYRFQPAANRHELLKQGLEINGFTRDVSGAFVITNNSGIWSWDGIDEPRLMAEEADGAKCQMNDCIADPRGRLLAGSWFYDPGGSDYPLGKLICLDLGGKARVVDEGIHLANGLAFSPQCSTLYFTDSATRRIYAYDYDVESGTVKNRRVLVQVPSTEGLPDGLTVDSEGFLWSAQWYGSCVVRYDPDGRVERRIATPAKQTSSVAFGGPELMDLYITSAGKSESMPIMPPGYDPHTGCFGGPLFHFRAEVPGKLEFKTKLTARVV